MFFVLGDDPNMNVIHGIIIGLIVPLYIILIAVIMYLKRRGKLTTFKQAFYLLILLISI